MSKSAEDEPVTFRVVMTSDAAVKEVPLTTSTTKLMELKQILANEKYFGSKAPVRRQRLFHLGRELKSGGRSLCNLGLGRFNNRILHLYIRPDEFLAEGAPSRKRSRATSESTQVCQRQRQTTNTNNANGGSSMSRPPTNNHSNAIDLVDSSDDDEVEIIEVL